MGDVTPFDVYTGQSLEILQRRKEVKSRILEARKKYNSTVGEHGFGFGSVH